MMFIVKIRSYASAVHEHIQRHSISRYHIMPLSALDKIQTRGTYENQNPSPSGCSNYRIRAFIYVQEESEGLDSLRPEIFRGAGPQRQLGH